MPFEFVDNSTPITPAARRRIRSQAARGKNVGRQITRPSRLQTQNRAAPATTQALVRSQATDHASNTDVSRQLGDGLSVFPFPDQPTPAARLLVQKAFSLLVQGPRSPPELKNAVGTPKGHSTALLEFMFMDKAYYHCALAFTARAFGFMYGEQNLSESLYHFSIMFPLVNKQLSENNPNAISDATIALVLTMAHLEFWCGNMGQGAIHFDGLQQMVRLRGGLTALRASRPYLVMKILRADIDYALHLGIRTRYAVDEVRLLFDTGINQLLSPLKRILPNTVSVQITCPYEQYLGTELRKVQSDAKSLVWLMNEANAGRLEKLDGHVYHETLAMIFYRLLDICPLADINVANTNGPSTAVQLGVAAVITKLVRRIDFKLVSSPIVESLILSYAYISAHEQRYPDLVLWLLFVREATIASSNHNHETRLELFSIIRRTAHALNISTWEGVKALLTKHLWIHNLHDPPGRLLWQKSAVVPDVSVSRLEPTAATSVMPIFMAQG